MSEHLSTPPRRFGPDWLNEVTIRELGPSDSLEALTEFLHRAYKSLADRGLSFLATHQDSATTAQRVRQGTAFVAEYRGVLVGTITYRRPEHTPIPRQTPIPLAGSLSQLGVDPRHRQSGLGRRLFEHAEQFAQTQGAKALVLDTAESATDLIAWYVRMGYRFVEYIQWDVTNYRSVVLVKHLE